MVTAVEAITDRVREGLCFILDTYENAGRALRNVTGIPTGIGELAGGLGVLICDRPPEPIPLPEPPFTGGQCPEKYIVAYEFDDSGSTSGSVLAIGPIRGIVEVDGAAGSKQVFLQANSGVVFGGQCFNILNPSGPQNAFLGSYTPPPGEGGTARITGLTPCGADNCGNVPTPVPPPGNITYEGDDITYEGDDNVNITVPLALIFAPVYVAVDGTLRIPVNIQLGDLNFSGEATIAPEFNFEISPTFNPPGPGVPDDPDEIGEPGEPSDPIPEVEELESTIVGVLVFSDIDPDGSPSGILFPTGPDLYVPRLASVQFAVKTSNSIGWTPDQDVKNLECYVPCPAPQGAIAVRVSPMPGVVSRFTAVRGKPLTSF